MPGAQIDFLMTPFTENGSPLVGGTVEFYLEGTSTGVDVYAEKALSTNLGDTVTLESDGTKLVFVVATNFLKIVVKRADTTTFSTYDGIGVTLGGSSSVDAYLRDGSLPLAGNMDAAGFALTDVGDVDLGSGKSLDINHGHAYSVTAADMLAYGDATGYIRQYVGTAIARTFFGATEIWNWTASSVKAMVALDMNSQKITSIADGTTSTDGVSKGQMDTADALNLPLAGGTMTGAIEIFGTPSGSQAAKFSQIATAIASNSPQVFKASDNASVLNISATCSTTGCGKTGAYLSFTGGFAGNLISGHIKVLGTNSFFIYLNLSNATNDNTSSEGTVAATTDVSAIVGPETNSIQVFTRADDEVVVKYTSANAYPMYLQVTTFPVA